MPKRPRPATIDDFNGVLSNPHTGIFYRVSEELKQSLISSPTRDCQVITYEARDKLFVQGQDTSHLPIYLIKVGLFAVLNSYEEEDRTFIVSFNRSGDITGYLERLIRGVPEHLIPFNDFNESHSASEGAKSTMLAMTECEVIEIRGDSRDVLLKDHKVSTNLNRIIALKYLRRSAWAGAIRVYNRSEMVALLFQSLAAKPEEGGVGIVGDDPTLGKLPKDLTKGRRYVRLNCSMTQDDLAYAFGVTKQGFAKAFQKLKTDGWVIFQRGQVYLLEDIATKKQVISDKLRIRL